MGKICYNYFKIDCCVNYYHVKFEVQIRHVEREIKKDKIKLGVHCTNMVVNQAKILFRV
jgi:hypothetical protein